MCSAFKSIGLWLFAAALVATVGAAEIPFTPSLAEGDTFIHDPSTIIQAGTNYYVFGTGRGIRTKSSPDLIHWSAGEPVFREPLEWTLTQIPGSRGGCWAPDIIRVNGKYLLYYSVSTWGKQNSAIGLAVNSTLDPSDTNYAWRNAGPVISSTNGSAYNTIDPSVMQDKDGKLWLSFGSYWKGIYLTELDPQNGLRRDPALAPIQLAWNQSIEASCLTRHGPYYYLFVNWGQCCRGTNSTYEVRVGRSDQVTGPYRDRDGNDLSTGGGSPFLQSSGRFIGPGHIGIAIESNPNAPIRFSYHYYDADSDGRSRLAVGKIDWSSGWPVATN